MMRKDKKKKIKAKSERTLFIVSLVFTIIFACVMLYPLLFTFSASMKDSFSIYQVPPKAIPPKGNSLSIAIDYSDTELQGEDLKDAMLKDSALIYFRTQNKMAKDTLLETKIYGIRNGQTVFYTRAHQMMVQLEADYGVMSNAFPKKDVVLNGDRYVRAMDSFRYEFDEDGLNKTINIEDSEDSREWMDKVLASMKDNDIDGGRYIGVKHDSSFLLNLEVFKYYVKIPAYAYPKAARIVKYGFFAFMFNTILVIGFAIIAQVFLCSISAFAISRYLSPKVGRLVILFFLGAMMVPFASIMLPQLIMFRNIGAYNNYAALLLPFLYPYGFYVFLFKGFFDQIPRDYFEAAQLDGAGSISLYLKICMPLSKPIISLILLQTFIGNWNDFFWAWLVTEKQDLWTLNVALYSISNNSSTSQNSIMGLSVVTVIPVLIVTFIFSRQLKESIMSSGVKG